MAEPRETRDGLRELLADALTAETLETDLLLRYARDAASLADGERERVEAYLAASPAHRDRLRVLTRFALSQGAVLGGGDPAAAPGPSEGVVVAISSHPRWRVRTALVGTALAAGLALALLYAIPDAGLGPGKSPLQIAEERVGNGQEMARAMPKDEDLGETPERLAARVEPTSPPETRIAERAAPLAPAPEAPAIERPSEPPALERPRILAAAPPPPVPETLPSSPAAPESEGETTPAEVALGEPILLAMNFSGPLHYADPLGSTPLEPLAGVVRGRPPAPGLPTPQALVPAHIGRTLGESPTLYWYASMATDSRVEFVLVDPVSIDPLLEFTLDSPLPAGIHAVRLRDHGVLLEPGVEYRWFVSVSPDAGGRSADLITQGGIERMAPGAELQAKLEASEPGELGKLYAESGLWYDALASVSQAIEHAPQEARLRELRAGLLEQVGLREAAEYDRRAVEPSPAP